MSKRLRANGGDGGDGITTDGDDGVAVGGDGGHHIARITPFPPSHWTYNIPTVIMDFILSYISRRDELLIITHICKSWRLHSLRGAAWHSIFHKPYDDDWIQNSPVRADTWIPRIGPRVFSIREFYGPMAVSEVADIGNGFPALRLLDACLEIDIICGHQLNALSALNHLQTFKLTCGDIHQRAWTLPFAAPSLRALCVKLKNSRDTVLQLMWSPVGWNHLTQLELCGQIMPAIMDWSPSFKLPNLSMVQLDIRDPSASTLNTNHTDVMVQQLIWRMPNVTSLHLGSAIILKTPMPSLRKLIFGSNYAPSDATILTPTFMQILQQLEYLDIACSDVERIVACVIMPALTELRIGGHKDMKCMSAAVLVKALANAPRLTKCCISISTVAEADSTLIGNWCGAHYIDILSRSATARALIAANTC